MYSCSRWSLGYPRNMWTKTWLILAACLLLVFAVVPWSAAGPDWKTFANPEADLPTEPFAQSISEMPAAAKDVAMEKLRSLLASKTLKPAAAPRSRSVL